MSPLSRVFAAAAPIAPGAGEALCVWQRGAEVFHATAGEAADGLPWCADTLTPLFSATKALSAACLLLALYERGLTPELEVGELWPRFPAPHCTVAHVLSHQVGLAAWAQDAPVDDPAACRAAIESTTPAWLPPQHGYHPHTFGPMVDLLMLSLTGERICTYWETRVRRPLGLQAYIGLPASELPRVARLRLPRAQPPLPSSEFYRMYFDPHSPVHRAFHCVTGLASVREMNTLRGLQCGCPARGGVATARGLCMAYQALLGQLPGSPFPPAVREWLSTPRSTGADLTLRCHTAFTCGAMCAPAPFFGRGGFGHPGFGGYHAFAEPTTGLSFAYTLNHLHPAPLPGSRVEQLALAALSCAD